MSLPWGSNAYGIGEYGTGLENITLTLDGIAISASLGDETTAGEINSGWGRVEWGNFAWGDAYSAQATGISLTATLDNVLISTDVNVDVTGELLSSFLGNENVTIATEVFPSGFNINSNIGSVSFTITGSVSLSGEPATANLGTATLDANTLVDVTGQSITTSLGDESITGTANISLSGELLSANEGTPNLDANTIAEVSTIVPAYWGTETWGYGVWGNEPIETMAMTSDEGTVDPSPDATVTGIGFTADLAVGTVIIGTAEVPLTGEAMTASLGNESITGTANLTLTGFGITAEEGTVDPSPDAEVTGIGLMLL